MSDNQDNFPQLPEESWTEAGMESAEIFSNIFLSFIPILGPAISTTLGLEIKKLNDNRLRAYLKELEKYIKSIQQNIVMTDEFKDAILHAISNYMQSPSEKERIFASHLNSTFLKLLPNAEDPKMLYDTFFVFSELFNKLSLPTLDCLISFRQKFTASRATRYEIIEYFSTFSSLFGKHAFLELMNNSLIEEEGTTEQPPSFNLYAKEKEEELPLGGRIYKLQPLGALFADWLEAKCEVPQDE